ncbi:metallophosphoesterase family protein [Marinicauda sp. Alg238-R41]|uniref:metallophosphoesterase family protein n=1 Tax=Marinicauda sp. Alg238-R41 TaxID=2993447 RepID=UPI0022E78323|nr:metallophosphoesterase family protein [Marinicauda sp. Alg238-R41]
MLRKLLKTLTGGIERPAPPVGRIYAVGDIHGRNDLLARLLSVIEHDAKSEPAEFIFLGDYIDRGEDSRGVIERLIELAAQSPHRTTYLKGNHEATLLDFLSDPGVGPVWARFGGLETLASYGVTPPRTNEPEAWISVQNQFLDALPNAHREFFEGLHLSAERGCYLFVHAGVDPARRIDQQSEEDVLWIREVFLNDDRALERIIVHGHTPEERPVNDGRRIGLDTGAYITNRLTAARLEGARVAFLST